MPGGWGRNESAREGFLREQIFDDQGMSQDGLSIQTALESPTLLEADTIYQTEMPNNWLSPIGSRG